MTTTKDFEEAIRRAQAAMAGKHPPKMVNPEIVQKPVNLSKVQMWKDRETEEIFIRTRGPLGWQTVCDHRGKRILIASETERQALVKAQEIFSR